ncbi:hypothetical protein ON010_g213 [Phytophthora cinnamomi]|nr:hypothetical protein ON010_g213 [Phytophthora cinnamomi]
MERACCLVSIPIRPPLSSRSTPAPTICAYLLCLNCSPHWHSCYSNPGFQPDSTHHNSENPQRSLQVRDTEDDDESEDPKEEERRGSTGIAMLANMIMSAHKLPHAGADRKKDTMSDTFWTNSKFRAQLSTDSESTRLTIGVTRDTSNGRITIATSL